MILGLLKRLHTAFRARLVKHYRTQEVVKVYRAAHNLELRENPIQNWPLIEERHRQELAAIKAGRLDIVDRKSWAWPFLPASVTRLATPIMKATPYNLRRMSRTPVPMRAINLIKNAVIVQPWSVRPIDGVEAIDDEDSQKQRIEIAEKVFHHPNNQDSFQTWMEQGITDLCLFGGFPTELRYTLDPKRPLKMWNVNVESVRIFASWTEEITEEMPHYAQMTGLKGERGAILFWDDELMYIKDNPSTDNPFGLGKMEVAFMSVNDFLGVQGMAGRSGTDQVHKTWLWWEQPQNDSMYQTVRRHIQNELEGQAKVSIIGGMKKPEVIEILPTTEDDLLLNWQEMLIRMIANAFDMSALALGIEHDINRAVGQVLDDKDFRSAVVPMAKRIQENLTRKVLHEKLGWYDLEFAFLNLDDPDKQTMTEMMARMYSGNAITPNEWREKMGMEALDTPFADLTQFECMLLNLQAMAEVQNQSADKAAQRQLNVQDINQQKQEEKMREMGYDPNDPSQMMQPGGGGFPGGGGGGSQPPGGGLMKVTPGSMARGGQPPNPKALGLPKFPIAASRWSAKEIAKMPVNQVQDAMYLGQLPMSPSNLMDQMQEQEPNILEQMTDELREFFEEAIQKEKELNEKKPLKPKVVKDWEQEQKKRFREQGKRIQDFAQWLVKYGRFTGRPGGAGDRTAGIQKPNFGKGPTGLAGRPGNINPLRRN